MSGCNYTYEQGIRSRCTIQLSIGIACRVMLYKAQELQAMGNIGVTTEGTTILIKTQVSNDSVQQIQVPSC